MKKIFFVFCILFALSSFAQNRKNVQVSLPFKVIDAPDKMYFNSGQNVISVKVKKKLTTIQVFNTERMTEVSRKEYEDFPKGAEFEEVLQLDNKLYYFYTLWDKPVETEQLFVREISMENGTFISKGKLLIKHKGRLTGDFTSSGFYNFSLTNKFNFYYSYDKSKLLVQFRLKPEEKRDELNNDKIGFYIFNNELELLSGKIVKMPYSEKKMDIGDYTVDSEGNAYTLAFVFKDDSKKERKKDVNVNYHVELLKIKFGNEKEVEKTPINIKGKFINSIWINENTNKTLTCAGYFFNNSNDVGSANGVFTCKVDQNSEVSDYNIIDFPEELINQNVSNRTQKKNSKKDDEEKSELEDLVLRKILLQKDGSLVLIGEQYYVVTRVTTDSKGNMRYSYDYYYNYMIISKIDDTGKLVWIKKLAKKQKSTSGRGSLSFAYIKGETDHNLIFLDNYKNLHLADNQVPAMHIDGQGGFITAYKVNDETGAVSKHSLFDTRNVNGMEVYQFTTNRIIKTSASAFAIEFYKKKKQDVYIKVDLP